jgi:hypothetical protein
MLNNNPELINTKDAKGENLISIAVQKSKFSFISRFSLM